MIVFPSPPFGDHYSPKKLFKKLRALSGKVIALVVVKALLLYELLTTNDTPLAAKTAIIMVLGYLISPIDGFPDFLVGGYGDDVALMTGLIKSLESLITEEMRQRAESKASSFGG